nr:phosphate-starvation-inducible PsiE family protein [Acetobacter pasteurianus]
MRTLKIIERKAKHLKLYQLSNGKTVMEEISMKRSWHSRDWSRLVRLFNGLTFYERFEQAIILILIALIMLVTAIATVHLISAVWHLIVDIGIDPIKQEIFQEIFGAIFTVIIALEFKHSLLVVLAQHENVIRVRTIVLIALLAVARKFILLDLNKVSAMELFALSVAVLALGIVYWLALQLHFVLSSESMGNHDSGYDEWRYVC